MTAITITVATFIQRFEDGEISNIQIVAKVPGVDQWYVFCDWNDPSTEMQYRTVFKVTA